MFVLFIKLKIQPAILHRIFEKCVQMARASNHIDQHYCFASHLAAILITFCTICTFILRNYKLCCNFQFWRFFFFYLSLFWACFFFFALLFSMRKIHLNLASAAMKSAKKIWSENILVKYSAKSKTHTKKASDVPWNVRHNIVLV